MLFIVLAVTVLAADQIAKTLVVATVPAESSQDNADGLLRITLTRNPGAAFGLGSQFTPLITGFAILATTAGLLAGLRARTRGWIVVLGLITGHGAAGNLADRLARPPGPIHGAVIDWITVPF